MYNFLFQSILFRADIFLEHQQIRNCVKLIGYLVSAVNTVSSNPCVGPSPIIKISLFLLSICTDKLLPAPNILIFFPTLPSVNENSELASNHMPKPLYLYLYRLAFLVSFTDPNNQFSNVKSVFQFLNHGLSIIIFFSINAL